MAIPVFSTSKLKDLYLVALNMAALADNAEVT